MFKWGFNKALNYGKVFENGVIERSKTESYYEFSENPVKNDKVLGDILVTNGNEILIACIDTKRSKYFSIPSIGAFTGVTKSKHRAIYIFENGFMNNSEKFRRYVHDNLCKTFPHLNLENLSIEEACNNANSYAKWHLNIDLGIFIRMSRSGDLGLCFDNIPDEFKMSTDHWESPEFWRKLEKFLNY